MTSADERIARLEREVIAAQELLFLVLDHIDEPVVLDMVESKKKMADDRRIDLDFNDEAGTWTLQVVTFGEQ